MARPAYAKPGFAFCNRCSPITRRSRSPLTCRPSNSRNGTASCCAKFPAYASNPARRQILAHSRPAMPIWRSHRGSCSSGCSARASFPASVKFQISLPTPIAPTYNNMVPSDRPALLPALTQHLIGEVARIAAETPNDRIALQWDVCQEVLAWEGYYEPGPVDFRSETIDVLTRIGEAVPTAIELGYHLCYGSPADEHCVQPKDMGIMVEIANATSAGVARPIQFFHMPVPT